MHSMKPNFLLGISWLVVLVSAPLATWAQTSLAAKAVVATPAAQVHTYTLANGMTLWVKPDRRAPTAVHMVWVRVGSMDEVDGTSGVAHVLEHMMFKGTPTVKAGDFSRKVAALGGRISIASVPGQGTEFTISLPLTLAVMDGMVVSVAGQTMVVPITSILETIRPAPGDLHRVGTDDSLLSIRGRFIPTVDVARSLGFTDPSARADFPLLLLVEGENQSQCALVVDAVHDQRQVVIKGLDSNYGQVPGVSAATVLGDGQIALILDPDAIAAHRASPAAPVAQRPSPLHPEVHHGQH